MQLKLFEKHTSENKFQNCEQGKSYDYPWIISEAYNSDNTHEKIYAINIGILFPCFCIIFPHFCTVFTEICIALSHESQEFFFMYFIITKIIQAQSWGIIPVWVLIIGFLFWKL